MSAARLRPLGGVGEGVSDSRRDMQRRGPCPVPLSIREREKGMCCGEGSRGRLTFGPAKLDLEGVPSFKEAEWMSQVSTRQGSIF